MRVRAFKLRLIAACFTVLWTVTAGLVLLGYRPGGPIDLLVGLAALVPIAIAVIGLAWPPTARHDGIFAATVWLGLFATLVLVPSIGGVVFQLTSAGTQTILPSWQAAYPWLLALASTSLFSGLGAVRHLVGPFASRRRRLAMGVALGGVMTLGSGVLFGTAAIANELGLRDRPVTFSRFGPTDPALVLPACDAAIATPDTAHVEVSFTADVDSHPVGWANIVGIRSGTSVRWTADVAADSTLGRHGVWRTAAGAWQRNPERRLGGRPAGERRRRDARPPGGPRPRSRWRPGRRPRTAVSSSSKGRRPATAGSRSTVRSPGSAFPEIAWFVGEADLHRWRGELDYWIFADDQVGQVVMTVNGDAVRDGLDRPAGDDPGDDDRHRSRPAGLDLATRMSAGGSIAGSGPVRRQARPGRPAAAHRALPPGARRGRRPARGDRPGRWRCRAGRCTATCGPSSRRSRSRSGRRTAAGGSRRAGSCRRSSSPSPRAWRCSSRRG